MVYRLDFDLGLHRLVAAADGNGSGDYRSVKRLQFRMMAIMAAEVVQNTILPYFARDISKFGLRALSLLKH